ncbi:Holliday junction branch migration protein RuvA [Oscillatoria salina]|uniref:Holliday junction branch migration protein RuvA n=1 Tax=Oscillatoria salina TaxID=331517 RepID=UPI0013B60CD6|nr:Holliday junction branch migration protein RuvA [Oscillatoria salina]MBZ8182585.1 Holliday junction branch migration protein RuvA [Oscillatoria salina IIICB1]NET90032.1 Holliday junction branch migration protein RuvA [Kamptonema sp. SIO1D9]
MIGYLKGKVTNIIKSTNNRLILILEVNQIGYEVQIASRLARQLEENTSDESVQIFTHLQIREDQQILYGFASAAERDLFRQLISVSGIGTQLAIAAIDTLGLPNLVEAIVTGNIPTLVKIPGVGKKTAERIALELRTKLAQWRQAVGVATPANSATPANALTEDVEMTLLALGYSNSEIEQALSALSQDSQMLKNTKAEDWIKNAIAWLSQ